MSLFHLLIVVTLGICALCWVLSLLTNETSWVDRLWSIVPELYIGIVAEHAHWHNTTLNVMTVLSTLWGARLTFNFARKGGYSGMEDYRWQVLRDSMTKWQFQLFNIFFIVLYQNFLLLLIALPAYVVYQHPSVHFGVFDYVLSAVFLMLLCGETIADQQQWNFHQWKAEEKKLGRTPAPQFLQTGLFKYSRHPNYFCEISQWWVIFFFGALSAHSLVQWTWAAPILLTILFVGSTRFTEQISLSKYPEYVDYQKSTSAVIPWIPKHN